MKTKTATSEFPASQAAVFKMTTELAARKSHQSQQMKGVQMDKQNITPSDTRNPASYEEEALPIVSESNGKIVADSRDVADYFRKNHRDVLRDIRNLVAKGAEFGQRNFAPFKIKDLTGESTSNYNMTRDGFMLLVMGFTGAKALRLKLKYIAQFNAMEAQIADDTSDRQLGISKMTISKVTKLERAIDGLIGQVNALMINADARVAALEYVSVRELLEEAGAVQKRRGHVNRKIGWEMRERALTAGPPNPCRRCPHSNVWLFQRDFAAQYMLDRGDAHVADHNSRQMGQSIIKFPRNGERKS